jgi:hypothetical protein
VRRGFEGYFRPDDEYFRRIWRNATFAFDANALLKLYRYSDETRQQFFSVLDLIGDRVWLPHQVAFEFHSNRNSVIHVARPRTVTPRWPSSFEETP